MLQRNLAHHLSDFFECSRPSGKGDERITQLNHFCFAFAHIFCDNKTRNCVVLTRIDEKLRFNADDLTSDAQYTFGELAHKSRF